MPVDRAALREQLSFNPGVISLYTGIKIDGFNYTVQDIRAVISQTMDTCFSPFAPIGTDRIIDEFGFVQQRDNWMSWHASRPFDDIDCARKWLRKKLKRKKQTSNCFMLANSGKNILEYMKSQQIPIGETDIIDYSIGTGFCSIFNLMGLELYTYFCMDYTLVW